MYNLLTAFVTTGVLVFIVIYNTPFITVVTLGGTVLGSAVVGLCVSLLSFMLRRMLKSRMARLALGIVGCSTVIAGVVGGLPGWQLQYSVGAAVFLLALCIAVTLVNEFCLGEKERGL